jgi:hypothetical protein
MLYALRRYCGMSAREVLTKTPIWEIQMLIEGLQREFSKREE